MVAINLVPEIVIQARNARSRARNVLLVVGLVCVTSVGVLFSQKIMFIFSSHDGPLTERLVAELEALRETIDVHRRDVNQYELQVGKVRALRASQTEIARRLTDIPHLIPQHLTLSSLQITERQLILAGVASERSVVGELVSNLRSDTPSGEISVERLKDVNVERHVLQDFLIRETGLKKESVAIDSNTMQNEH